MTARRLLQSAQERGIILQAQAGRLRCAGPREALTPDLLDAIREHRQELLSELEADFAAQVAARVEAFTVEASRPGPVPFLTMPGFTGSQGCLSCGAALVAPFPPRCAACIEAAHRVLAMSARVNLPTADAGARPAPSTDWRTHEP